jgi:hypothetical protein
MLEETTQEKKNRIAREKRAQKKAEAAAVAAAAAVAEEEEEDQDQGDLNAAGRPATSGKGLMNPPEKPKGKRAREDEGDGGPRKPRKKK